MQEQVKLRYAKALELFLPHLPESGVILELNAEQLLYSRVFTEKGFKIINVELFHAQLMHDNKYAIDTFHKPLHEVILPFRSVNGIWAHQSFSAYTRKEFMQMLDRCSDWLAPSGVIAFCMPEGEGEMHLQTHTHHGPERRLKVFYQADELARMLDQLDFEVLEAWREPHQDHQYIHIICKNG